MLKKTRVTKVIESKRSARQQLNNKTSFARFLAIHLYILLLSKFLVKFPTPTSLPAQFLRFCTSFTFFFFYQSPLIHLFFSFIRYTHYYLIEFTSLKLI